MPKLLTKHLKMEQQSKLLKSFVINFKGQAFHICKDALKQLRCTKLILQVVLVLDQARIIVISPIY